MFQEVLDNVIPETGALCEAYNDAVYFKCGCIRGPD